MRTFSCACGAQIFFENVTCLECERELGFVPPLLVLSAIEPDAEGAFLASADGNRYRKCRNDVAQGVCNWLLPADDPEELCRACRLNRVVPDLSVPENRVQWARVESAKRRLLYSLYDLGLPVTSSGDADDTSLAFDIKADTPAEGRVLTGHSDGLITLNLAEADPVLREKARTEMAERYRTLLGHFRHEIGHYYWDQLIRDGVWLDPFRALFGDERADYTEALQRHYDTPAVDWQNEHVSAYASSHPWEDWAETWAHYLHIHDTLDTARHFGLVPDRAHAEPGDEGAFASRLDAWDEVAIALNAMNRSMGLPDPYPFALSERVREKLGFVDQVIRDARSHELSLDGAA